MAGVKKTQSFTSFQSNQGYTKLLSQIACTSAYLYFGNEKKRTQILELFASNPDLETGTDI